MMEKESDLVTPESLRRSGKMMRTEICRGNDYRCDSISNMGIVIIWGVAFALVVIGLLSLLLAALDRASSRRKHPRGTRSDDGALFDVLLQDNHAPHLGCDSSHPAASHGANDMSYGGDCSSHFGHH